MTKRSGQRRPQSTLQAPSLERSAGGDIGGYGHPGRKVVSMYAPGQGANQGTHGRPCPRAATSVRGFAPPCATVAHNGGPTASGPVRKPSFIPDFHPSAGAPETPVRNPLKTGRIQPKTGRPRVGIILCKPTRVLPIFGRSENNAVRIKTRRPARCRLTPGRVIRGQVSAGGTVATATRFLKEAHHDPFPDIFSFGFPYSHVGPGRRASRS